MKLSTALWALSSAAGALAASSGHVFLLDPSTSSLHPTPHHDTISPSTAQLIFAQRLGLSSFYDLPADVDDKTLSQLNAFAGRPSTLLRGNRYQEQSHRLLVIVDNVDSPIDILPTAEGAFFFDMSPAPHHEQTEALIKEFAQHAEQAVKQEDIYSSTTPTAIQKVAALSESNSFITHGSRSILRIGSVKATVNAHGRSSKQYSAHIESLRSLLQDLVSAPDAYSGGLTIIMTPPESQSAKRSDKTYNLTPRVANAARMPSEAPLTDAISRVVSGSEGSSFVSSSENLNALASNKNITRGPIPSYYPSKSACQERTNNCTGHGECVLQFKQKDADGKDRDVFGCACKPSITKLKSGGQKTTRYGGGACNKVDVSDSFWLLAGTTIFFLFLISWGVGLLYSMGNDDLPSVIGAGVSGPRATK